MSEKKDLNWDVAFLIFLVFLFLTKLLILYFLKLPLSFDEAYYWDWSRHLAFGYYSKPPMVAWLIRLSTWIFGNSEFAVRLPALLCMVLASGFSYLLFKELTDRKTAFFSAVFISLLPIITIYSFVMTIDPPLIFFWILATYFFVKYLKSRKAFFAILSGVTAGLALLSKQTAAAFCFFGLVFSLLYLRNEPGCKLYLITFVLIPFLVYLPNVFWNLKHGLLMLKHTESHFTRHEHNLKGFLNFFAGCIGAYTPFFVYLIGLGVGYLFSKTKSLILNFLYLEHLPFLLLVMGASLFIKMNVNWIFPFVIGGYFLALRSWESELLSFSRLKKALVKVSFAIGILGSFLLVALALSPKHFPKTAQRLLSKFQGWKVLASKVSESYDGRYPLVCGDRHIAAELAFYLKTHPEPYVANFSRVAKSQYDVWRKVTQLAGKEVVFVGSGNNKPRFLKKAKLLRVVLVKLPYKVEVFSVWQGIIK